MATREDLQYKLEEIFGSKNVYYQSPPSTGMKYPAILYSKSRISVKRANDRNYSTRTAYELIVIDRLPDNPVIQRLMELPYCSYDRVYKADNLYHDVLTLYY